ncbi:dihydrofolate reductase [Fusobacterium necrophorum]|uniref:dihydrofolate reductase n=1 Tax=Fusobacterium necrophorum TaxID=859 RepID=UPI00254CCE68|nr:dihydrofolate reductase [Fusobacterium necrophorum]MDK4525013.1 dihydrofolate reductase [Fusobacterium necrophorum]
MLEMIIAGIQKENKLLLGDSKPEGNGMLWHIPEDFQWFREKTKNKILLVGETTSKFMPIEKINGNLGRKVIVLKTKEDSNKIIKELKKNPSENYIVCGGLTIYNYFLDHCIFDKIYFTLINNNVKYKIPKEPLFLNLNKFNQYSFNDFHETENAKFYILKKR